MLGEAPDQDRECQESYAPQNSKFSTMSPARPQPKSENPRQVPSLVQSADYQERKGTFFFTLFINNVLNYNLTIFLVVDFISK